MWGPEPQAAFVRPPVGSAGRPVRPEPAAGVEGPVSEGRPRGQRGQREASGQRRPMRPLPRALPPWAGRGSAEHRGQPSCKQLRERWQRVVQIELTILKYFIRDFACFFRAFDFRNNLAS